MKPKPSSRRSWRKGRVKMKEESVRCGTFDVAAIEERWTKREIDKVVCAWSREHMISLSALDLNALVDSLYKSKSMHEGNKKP